MNSLEIGNRSGRQTRVSVSINMKPLARPGEGLHVASYFFGPLLPRPPPDGLPVVLGPLGGRGFLAGMVQSPVAPFADFSGRRRRLARADD
jgi:hypothetical protein